ncbi:hypothetical protein ANCCAN_22226 [Ancylostoma caninum]|uniref:Uncharacterized protein n=1 Tax=Ancylostoma caninum TaxID=29170 RepID=A0A368FMG5_ANCCA|nr:hypothetical protein ANCCAN_22226 [Ancylostoma caninum]
MDFERDPTEDEIPRFIIERKPANLEDLHEEVTQSSCSEEEDTTFGSDDKCEV